MKEGIVNTGRPGSESVRSGGVTVRGRGSDRYISDDNLFTTTANKFTWFVV